MLGAVKTQTNEIKRTKSEQKLTEIRTNTKIQNGGSTIYNHHLGMLKELTLLFVIPSLCLPFVMILKSVFFKSTAQCKNGFLSASHPFPSSPPPDSFICPEVQQ